MSRITAVICTYNRYDLLPAAIDSLRAQTLDAREFNIVVVDNSPDHEAAQSFGRQFTGIKNLNYQVEQQSGLAHARNVAVRNCSTEFIAFMDDDAVAEPDWLEQVLIAFDRFGTRAGAVGGRVEPIWDMPRPPWLHDNLLGYVSVVNWGGHCRVANPEEWFAGTNVSYRTSQIRQHGGFPEHLGRIGQGIALLGNEELALSERMRAAGQLLIYAPDARVHHRVPAERLTQTWFRRRAAWQAASDFVLRPDQTSEHARGHWPDLLRYLNSLPPRDRNLRGLYAPSDDADVFSRQIGAVYMSTVANLSGFEYAEY